VEESDLPTPIGNGRDVLGMYVSISCYTHECSDTRKEDVSNL
jgi:hypothetical protein